MRLEPSEQEFLAAEVGAFAERARTAEARAGYLELLQQVRAGQVDEPWLELLGRVLGASLESGRLRALHGPHAEMQANRLYAQTPQGRAVRATVDATNEALQVLKGQQLETVAFAVRGPGAFRLTLTTEQCSLQLVVDRLGVRVHSVETGG